jgi:hypothetical protein
VCLYVCWNTIEEVLSTRDILPAFSLKLATERHPINIEGGRRADNRRQIESRPLSGRFAGDCPSAPGALRIIWPKWWGKKVKEPHRNISEGEQTRKNLRRIGETRRTYTNKEKRTHANKQTGKQEDKRTKKHTH